jgi:hypothetical protein
MTDDPMKETTAGIPYREIDPAAKYLVTTVIPDPDPQYREYICTSDDLPTVVQGVRSDSQGETIVNIEEVEPDV